MPAHRASDLLYESEAALRLVDDALHRMIDLVQPHASLAGTPGEADANADVADVADVAAGADMAPAADDERRAGLERALLLLGELDAGQGRATQR